MNYLLIDPYRQTIETIPMTGPRVPDESHPAAGIVRGLLLTRYVDCQFLPDGDVVAFHHDDLLNTSPTGAMIQGCLTFGYALIVPTATRGTLATDAEALGEEIQWLNTLEQCRQAVTKAHF